MRKLAEQPKQNLRVAYIDSNEVNSLEASAKHILKLTKELNRYTADHHNKLEGLFKLAKEKTRGIFQLIEEKQDFDAIDEEFQSFVLLLEVIKDCVPERLFYGLEQLIFQLTDEEASR